MSDGRTPIDALAASAIGTLAFLIVALTPPGIHLSLPIPLYAALGVGTVVTLGLVSRRAAPGPAYVVSSSVGLTLLALVAVDSSPGVSLAVWWPAWGLHASNTAYSLTGRTRLLAVGAGAISLAGAVVSTSTTAADGVLHLGSYLVLSGLVAALARHHRDIGTAHRLVANEVASRTRLLVTLGQMNRLDVEEIAAAAVGGLTDAGYAMCTFGLVDDDTQMITSLASVGFTPDARLDRPVPVDAGLAGEAFRTGRSVVIEDYARWAGRMGDRDGIGGAVGVPVVVDGRPAAVLLGARETPGRPEPEQLEVIEILAAQAARALMNARRFDDQQRTATRFAELDRLEEDFIASVTHELRTPLTIIRGVSETLSTHRGELPHDVSTELIRRLLSHAERLDGLIHKMLYVSQLDAGAIEPRPVPTDPRTIVSSVLASSFATEQGDVELSVEVDRVRCDPPLIALVLEQLLSNALVHNPRGTRVAVDVVMTEAGVEFTVRDEGVGIDRADERFVGRQFFRGGPSTRRSSSGLGLGLSIADHLLRAHGSGLVIQSTPGAGTSASFTLSNDQATTPASTSAATRASS